MSDIHVFKRYEKKYLLSAGQYEKLILEIGDTLLPDQYEKSLVQNIYFDTDKCQLIRTSLEKPVYKEKLRLRYYNELVDEGQGYLEIKKKYKGIVYKRRESMCIQDALNFIAHPPEKPKTQIERELAWFTRYYGDLKPAMYLNYMRKAYVYKENKDVRITFDTDITYRSYDIGFDNLEGEKLLDDGQVLMELKVPAAIPMEWVKAFEKLDIYPTSYSKYGIAYTVENKLVS